MARKRKVERTRGKAPAHDILKIKDDQPGIITVELNAMSSDLAGFLGFAQVEPVNCRSKLPPGLTKRARKTDIAAAALAQRDAALAELEALRGINAALAGENRRAWAMVRKLAAEGGA